MSSLIHMYFNGFFVFVVVFSLMFGGAPPYAEATDFGTPPLVQETAIGALAWIEPKSRVIKVGAPNMLDGARVERLDVQEGDVVTKGQVLGTFSTYERNRAALEVAKANLGLAKANLARVQSGSKESDIVSQRQAIQSLKARESAAEENFLRIEMLHTQRVASKAEYDLAKSERDSLIAQRKAAEATLISIEQVHPDDIEVAKAQVLVAEAELEVAKANLDMSTIISPLDGMVITIYARASEAIGDFGILDLADLSVMDAVAEVDENNILSIRKGQRAEVSIPVLDYKFSGVVREVGRQIKRNSVLDFDSNQMLDTRVFEVRIQLDEVHNDISSRLINKKARARFHP